MTFEAFPELWPDELLYSGLARYRDRLRLPSEGEFMRMLFTSELTTVVIDLPSHLEHLASSIPTPFGYSAQYIIRNHTLAPFYKPFLPKQKFPKFVEALLSRKPGGARRFVALNSKEKHSEWLRYCSFCAKEDIDKFKEPYWHRSHQIPNVKVCWKHGAILCESNVPTSELTSFVSAKRIVLEETSDSIDHNNPDHLFLWQMAKDCYWLLNQNNLELTNELLSQAYQKAYKEKGLLRPSGSVSRTKLRAVIQKKCSQNLLKAFGIDLDNYQHLVRLGGINNVAIAPSRHILVIQSLGYSLDDFFCDKVARTANTPRNFLSEGPWPCLNKVCTAYGQLGIESGILCQSQGYSERRWRFTCPECGLIYSRAESKSTFKDIRVIEYGPVWEEELRKLWAEPRPNRKDIQDRLNVSWDTVKRHAQQLGLPMSIHGKRLKPVSRPLKRSLIRDKHRGIFLKILQEHPDAGPMEITKLIRHTVDWLNINDLVWYEEHQPDAIAIDRIRNDWEKLDSELSSKAKQVCELRKADKCGSERVTVFSITGDLGLAKTYITNNKTKLRRTLETITPFVETADEYAIRKLQCAKLDAQSNGQLLTRHQLIAKARILHTSKHPLVKAAIDQAIEELKVLGLFRE